MSKSSLPSSLDTDWVDLSAPLESLRRRLERDADPWYRKFFQSALPRESVAMGVRIPLIRAAVKEILAVDGDAFLNGAIFGIGIRAKARWRRALQQTTCEERLALAFLIGRVKVDFDRRLDLIAGFVPLIDSWAVCDEFCAAIKPKPSDKVELWDYLDAYLASEEPYALRFAVVMMLKLFVDKTHIDAIFDRVERLASRGIDAHTVQMGTAWLLAETFIKFPDATLRYFKENSLDDFTFNMAIQKICDSLRVDDATKDEMRARKRPKRRD